MRPYSCALGPLTLSVRPTSDPKRLDVRVTKKPTDKFQQALIIRPGITLRLVKNKAFRVVQVKAFAPRIRYGHMVAGGIVEII